LLSPAVIARPHKTKDPNDAPFLPLHLTYPYGSKVIKRGTEAEVNSQLTSLYAPKVDAKDTYSSSSGSNYQRDSYYSDPYSTNSTPSIVYPPYYSDSEAYVYANAPYPAYNSYPAAYAVNPTSYPVSSYPNYYYQPSYYYPHYFSHALFPPSPSPAPPTSGVDYHETSQVPIAEDDKRDKKGERPKEDTTQDAPASQFVDGGNYIIGNSRDLDVQSSTYKAVNPNIQLTRDVQVKNQPIYLPKIYKVVNVAGQPVSPNYPLPAAYVKTQQIEQMTNQALADLLTQNVQQQTGSSAYESSGTLNGANDGSYHNQDVYNSNAPQYVNPSDTRNKPGITYVIDSAGIAKVNERAKQQSSQSAPSKNTKYSNVYTRKPASRNHSQAPYASLESDSNHRTRVTNGRPTGQTVTYVSYDASQNYGGTYSQSGNKQEQNYGTYQGQPGSYQNEGFTVAPQSPRSHTYQYSAYESEQVQQPQQDEINSDENNFRTKQYKG